MTPEDNLFLNEVEENRWLLEHTHEFIEIVCVLSGKGLHYIGGTSIHVEPDEVYLLPVGVSHVFRPAAHPGRLRVRNLLIRPDWLAQVAHMAGDPELADTVNWLSGTSGSQSSPQWRRIGHGVGILALTHRMLTLQQRQLPFWRTRMLAHLLELLTLLQEDMDADVPARETALEAALRRIDLRLLSLASLAKQLDVSERHVSRLFRREYGTTFGRYAARLRIEESCKRLAETDLPVAEIRRSVGWQDAGQFAVQFRRHTGMTPSQYRRQACRREDQDPASV